MAQHDARRRRRRSRARPARIPCCARPGSSRARCARTCTQPVSAMANDQHGEGQRVVRVGEHRAADAVDQQRHQQRRERQHHVAHAHDEGVDACRRQSPTAGPAPTPSTIDSTTDARPTNSEMRAPYMMVDRMSRPWSSVPSRKLRLPPSIQAGGRRASLRSIVARSKGLCGASQGANSAQNRHSSGRQRRDDGHRRVAEAVPDVAVEEAGESAGGPDAVTSCSSAQCPVVGRSMRRRGSTAKYSRSTTRLMITKISAIRHR